MEQVEEESKNGSASEVEDHIFRQISIPRTLGNLSMEKVEKELFGIEALPIYSKVVTGIIPPTVIKEDAKDNNSDSSSESDDSEL